MAGASDVVASNTETGTEMGSRLLGKFGAKAPALQVLRQALRKQASSPPCHLQLEKH